MRVVAVGGQVGLLVLRVVVGLLFIVTGIQKFVDHAHYVGLFTHWHVPLPMASVYLNGIVEAVCGLALLAGIATRTAAGILLVNMVVAILTAGLTDGRQYLVLPPVLALTCLVLIVAGGGALQLLPTQSVVPSELVRRVAAGQQD